MIPKDYTEALKDYVNREVAAIQALDLNSINDVMNTLEEAREEGKRIYICGNGGSSATASHFVCDFNKGLNDGIKRPYDFQCLSDNTPIASAISNDIGYDEVFRYQIKGRIHQGDILFGISGSGNSANVVNAMEYAKSVGATIVALVGYDGGKMKKLADHCIHVNINDMQISEDIHMMMDHIMMYVIGHSND